MTKPKILITGNLSLFVMNSLLQQYMGGEIDIVIDRMGVDISDYDMIAEGGNLLPVLKEDQEVEFADSFNELCESIKLIEDEPKWTATKTKTIAKHDYPWYHKPRF